MSSASQAKGFLEYTDDSEETATSTASVVRQIVRAARPESTGPHSPPRSTSPPQQPDRRSLVECASVSLGLTADAGVAKAPLPEGFGSDLELQLRKAEASSSDSSLSALASPSSAASSLPEQIVDSQLRISRALEAVEEKINAVIKTRVQVFTDKTTKNHKTLKAARAELQLLQSVVGPYLVGSYVDQIVARHYPAAHARPPAQSLADYVQSTEPAVPLPAGVTPSQLAGLLPLSDAKLHGLDSQLNNPALRTLVPKDAAKLLDDLAAAAAH